MRAHPLDKVFNPESSLQSKTSTVLTILPKGFCFIPPPPIAIDLKNDVVDVPDEGISVVDKASGVSKRWKWGTKKVFKYSVFGKGNSESVFFACMRSVHV